MPYQLTGKPALAGVDVALTARCTLHDMCVLSHATLGLLLHVLRVTLLRWVLLCLSGRIYNGQFNYLTSIIRLQIENRPTQRFLFSKARKSMFG